jgi:hypothetical protein
VDDAELDIAAMARLLIELRERRGWIVLADDAGSTALHNESIRRVCWRCGAERTAALADRFTDDEREDDHERRAGKHRRGAEHAARHRAVRCATKRHRQGERRQRVDCRAQVSAERILLVIRRWLPHLARSIARNLATARLRVAETVPRGI